MKRPTLSTLHLALGLSLALHAAVLSLRLVPALDVGRMPQDSALDVILVNAQTGQQPDQAQALAQTAMAGGGDGAHGRATSPLPLAPAGPGERHGTQPQADALRAEAPDLAPSSFQVDSLRASTPPSDPQPDAPGSDQTGQEQEQHLQRQWLAEIERRIQRDNAQPRKRVIGPATREAVYAAYYDRLRRAIEDRGTANFPQSQGRKLYGELTMLIHVDGEGQVRSTEVLQSSGNPLLDRQARAIARSAAPFGRFSPAMRRQADQLAVLSRFRFTRDDTLDTQAGRPAPGATRS